MTSSDLFTQLEAATEKGELLADSLANIKELLASSDDPVALAAVTELATAAAWSELNDRFFRKLAFGTGGLRGRTIGRIVTTAEQGNGGPNDRPEFPCVGTNAMNYFNVSRATQGLVRYLRQYVGSGHRPSLVLSYDTRHFSADFANLAAKVASENGCDVHLFDGPRSTPEMSFAVRLLNATAGVQLTASHNPAHDNGYKVNFSDGAQIIEPHASSIIKEVNATPGDTYEALPKDQQGIIRVIGEEIDTPYLARLETLLLQPDLVKSCGGLKVVFTALHGTGGVLVPTLLRRLGFDVITVPEQDIMDGRFPTVASPNPENGPALKMGMDLADQTGADLVIGTDPDNDRMGVAVRDDNGKMILITGNQIGSLMAWYRTKTFFDLGIIHDGNKANALLIKTFVTTNLQRAIARKHGIGCLDTLTGFKYISAKLGQYEAALPEDIKQNYRNLSDEETRTARLAHSKFFVFGGEESYGYLGTDFVRDKDGNGAVVMFAELAACARSLGLSIPALMDRIYQEYGYFLEVNQSKVFEGAQGAAQIQKLADSYSNQPPKAVDGSPVTRIQDFARDTITDEEGEMIPKEKMLFVYLEDGRSFAVRPSGTEPKIKYYLFGQSLPTGSGFTTEELAQARQNVTQSLATLWTWLDADIEARLS